MKLHDLKLLANELLKSDNIWINTQLLSRIDEIIPANEMQKFKTSKAFFLCVIAGHLEIVWKLEKKAGTWICNLPKNVTNKLSTFVQNKYSDS